MITIRQSISKITRSILPGAILLLALALLISLVAPANAASTVYYSVLAETFQPIDSTIQYDNFSAYLTTTANSTIHPLNAAYIGHVSLPDGATITGLSCTGNDTDSTHEFTVTLYRYNINNPIYVYDAVSNNPTSGVSFASGKISIAATIQTTGGKNIVDNSQWAYGIYAQVPKPAGTSQLGILSCRVDATYPVSLPFISK